MRCTDLIKEKLFPATSHQKTLIKSVEGSKQFDEAFELLFFESKEEALQKTLAPVLRQQTIRHMRHSEYPYAANFRTTYQDIYGENCTDYLTTQSKDGVWGTDVEAGALAELLDVTVMVTPVREGVLQTSMKIREASDPAAPIIHLYNANNTHWYIYDACPNKTMGDGNCLYNAFAQALRQIVLHEKANDKQIKNMISVYKMQDELLAMATGLPLTPLSDLLNAIKNATNQADHAFALELAKQDMKQKEANQSLSDMQHKSSRFNRFIFSSTLLFIAGIVIGTTLAATGIFAPFGIAVAGVMAIGALGGVSACLIGVPMVWYSSTKTNAPSNRLYKVHCDVVDSYTGMTNRLGPSFRDDEKMKQQNNEVKNTVLTLSHNTQTLTENQSSSKHFTM